MGRKRVYLTVHRVIVTSSMNPPIGGPHMKVRVGSLLPVTGCGSRLSGGWAQESS
jgi:hypothetical protein